MDFDLTDEQELIRATAREFADREIFPRAKENARNEHFDLELWKATHKWLELNSEDKLVATRLEETRTSLEETRAAWTSKDAHVVGVDFVNVASWVVATDA